MALSKVYRGYVIEQRGDTGQWYILNAPTYTNSNFFSPGPHGGWSVATHQVDILVDHVLKGEQVSSQQDQRPRQPTQQHHGSAPFAFWVVLFIFLWVYGWLTS